MCFLRAEVGEEDQLVPLVNGWQFKEQYGTKWSSDGTLECSREVSEPCKEIVVELHGEAKKRRSWLVEGTYLPVKGVVVRGRPVGSDDDNWFEDRTVKMFEQQFDFLDSYWVFSSRKESDDDGDRGVKILKTFWCRGVNNKHHAAESWDMKFEFPWCLSQIPNPISPQRDVC